MPAPAPSLTATWEALAQTIASYHDVLDGIGTAFPGEISARNLTIVARRRSSAPTAIGVARGVSR